MANHALYRRGIIRQDQCLHRLVATFLTAKFVSELTEGVVDYVVPELGASICTAKITLYLQVFHVHPTLHLQSVQRGFIVDGTIN